LLTQGTNVYTWDAANRLIEANVDGVVSNFKYNGLGQRTEQTVGGVTTQYMLDVAGGLPEAIVATTGRASIRYVQIQGQILAQYDSGTWTYVAPDALGSVRQLADADGHVTLAQHYDPFGNLLETAGQGASEFGYTGEWWDRYMELYYLKARWYDPSVGRFLAKDPWPGGLFHPLTLNGWSYVENNPVNFADPSGYITEKEAPDADDIVVRLMATYQARVVKDWGFVNVPGIPTWGIPPSCRWEEGDWTIDELKTLESGVTKLADTMGGADKVISNIGGLTVEQGYLLMARGKTMRHRIRFTDSPISIDEWTVVHELAHAWDANFSWRLSKEMKEYVGGKWLLFPKAPPGGIRYRYDPSEWPPPAGININFDAKEDFAESVTAFVYPGKATDKAARPPEYGGVPYGDYGYDNYYETARAVYIAELLGLSRERSKWAEIW
jgi:RHS repeat-associated protein